MAHDPKPKRTISYVFFSVLLLCLLAVGGMAVSTFSDNLQNTVIVEESPATATIPVTTTAAPAAVNTATTTTTTAVTTTTVTVTTTTATTLPPYTRPLSGEVIARFSDTPQYNETLAEYRVHRAVDIGGQIGDTVCAFSSGEVIETGQDLLLGDYLIIDHHDGTQSRYGGVKASVRVGVSVKTEDVIGTLSAVPFEAHMQPHLHFELLKDGQAVDPTPLWK